MALLNIQKLQVGVTGITPSQAFIDTNDTIAEITTAGYLNHAMNNGADLTESTICAVSTKTSPSAISTQVGWYEVSYNTSTKDWSLASSGSPGSVTLPTIANHIATFTNTTGNLSEDPATAISGGNIQAGLSGTAGYLSSFPSTAAKGSLRLVAVDNTGDTLVTLSNAAHGQATVISFPDSGQATTNVLLTNSAGTQTIATGSLALSLGTLTLGSSGHASSLIVFPSTAANGTLILAAVNAGGAFNTTISNGTMGQSTVMTIPDAGASTGQFLVKTAALVDGQLIKASGTAGKVVGAGFSVLANTTAAYGGGGVSNAFTATGLGATSIVTAVILTSTNAVAIAKAVPTANTLTVTFSADPGAATTVSWIAITPAV